MGVKTRRSVSSNRRWLHTPNPFLNGRTPLEAAATDEGFQEADEVLTRIEFGVLG